MTGNQEIALTRESPFLLRFKAYLKERFPLLGHGLLIVSFYSSNQFLAHALTRPGQPMRYDTSSLMGAATLLCLFLHLRLFDDQKDYDDDCRHYPERVLQRGVVSLEELKFLAVAVIAVEFLLAGLKGPGALLSVLLAVAFSLLMLKEFFVRDWLKRYFLVYASTHMLIIPLLTVVIFSFATGGYVWDVPGWYWLYSLVGFFVAFNWEISRKIRAPEQEREGLDSYTKIFGTYGAAYLVLLIRVIDTVLVALVGYHLELAWWFYATLIALFIACAAGVVHYRFWTTPATANRMQMYAGIYIVAFDLTLAVAIAARYRLDAL